MKTYSASLLMALALALPAANLMAQDDEKPVNPAAPAINRATTQARAIPASVPVIRVANRPVPPLINALDANHDGTIDETEIANASKALKTLDKNGDGKLTMEELRPQPPNGGNPGGPGNAGRPNRPPQGQGGRPPGPGNEN